MPGPRGLRAEAAGAPVPRAWALQQGAATVGKPVPAAEAQHRQKTVTV